MQKIWNVRVKIIQSVVGSLGAITKQFGNRLKETGIIKEMGQVQETVLLETAIILGTVRLTILKAKADGCSLILREFSSIVLQCIRTIIMITSLLR